MNSAFPGSLPRGAREAISAGVQRVFGDNLLGEMLLTSSFVAGGAVAILMLVRRATGSTILAAVTAAVALFASPRPYDYDKFLFYALGLLYFAAYGRNQLILSPEEEFALSKGAKAHD